MTAVFLVATLLPFLVASRVVRGWRGGLPIPEDRVRFETLVLGTGGLSAILHALIFTGLLSIPAVAAAGAAAHRIDGAVSGLRDHAAAGHTPHSWRVTVA
jgi:hypothetical protein